jgi:hypothetical protein
MRRSHRYRGFNELPHFSCHDIIRNPDFGKDSMWFARHLREVFAIGADLARLPGTEARPLAVK